MRLIHRRAIPFLRNTVLAIPASIHPYKVGARSQWPIFDRKEIINTDHGATFKRLIPENTSEKSISSDISMKDLKQYKVQISNSSARRSNGNHLEESLKTSLEDPCTLKIHFAVGKKSRMFDRNKIIANSDHGATSKNMQNVSYKAEEIHSPQSRKRTQCTCYSNDSHSLDDERAKSEERLSKNRKRNMRD